MFYVEFISIEKSREKNFLPKRNRILANFSIYIYIYIYTYIYIHIYVILRKKLQ